MIKKLVAPLLVGALTLGISSPAFAYQVKPGDTLYKISQQEGTTVQHLMDLNPSIQNPDLIYAGANLVTTGAVARNQTNVQQASPQRGNSTHPTTNSSNEITLLAQLVHAEANGQPYEGKVAVACVVLNRVHSGKFPNTIEGVIYQSGQFSPVSNGAINNSPTQSDIAAVRDALNNNRYQGALYFYNPKYAGGSWWDSKPTVAVIGDHVFK